MEGPEEEREEGKRVRTIERIKAGEWRRINGGTDGTEVVLVEDEDGVEASARITGSYAACKALTS